MKRLEIGNRLIGDGCVPLVIAEIGINHEGDVSKAKRMIDDAFDAGCECVKFQTHIVEDEMIENDVVPGNASESIWTMMRRCALTADEERELKHYTEEKGMLFLSTPFSRAAAIQLNELGVCAFKIGSGECNNYPLIELIASFGKPVILSTGMNDLDSILPAVQILRSQNIPFVLMHCTSMYPTPYDKVRLGALAQMSEAFPDALMGLSDHSIGNYTCFAAVALGCSILEKHFVSDKTWPGPDVPISLDPHEIRDLIQGVTAIYEASGGDKVVLSEEGPTIAFAYASVVTIKPVRSGECFSKDNIWVKRPGTGNIKAASYHEILGKTASRDIGENIQLSPDDIIGFKDA